MPGKKKVIIIISFIVIVTAGYFLGKDKLAGEKEVIEASGTIEATTVELTAKVAGTLENISAKVGDPVKQGEQVAKISREDLVAQRKKDALNMEIAQNKLDQILSGARFEQIKQAQAEVNIQHVACDQAEKELARAEELYKEGSIAEVELEKVQNKVAVARNQLEAAEANLSLLIAGSSDHEVRAAQNQVKMLQAVLAAHDAVLADLKIKSPLTGNIISKNFATGEFITQGASLATVADLDKVWINVYIPTDELPYVKWGKKVCFSVSGYNNTFEGVIKEIASKAEFTPKTIQTKKERVNIVYKVKIQADNSERILKPGMPADVVIPKSQNSGKEDDRQ